jgi:uncharacterized protein YdeI (YjbR/CyaY-like superfamily)
MAKANKNPKVDAYLERARQWQEEMTKLRAIVLDCGVTEELKWGCPCYTVNDNNVVLIHAFKEYCALLFMKGTLLKDEEGILVQQTKNVQSGRQIRFTSLQQITKMKAVIKAYVQEAIAVEQAGLKVEFKDTGEFDFPDEFQTKIDEMPELRAAFEALTPGRQRGYLLHFSGAKQSKTRADRIEKCVQHIMNGKGLND